MDPASVPADRKETFSDWQLTAKRGQSYLAIISLSILLNSDFESLSILGSDFLFSVQVPWHRTICENHPIATTLKISASTGTTSPDFS